MANKLVQQLAHDEALQAQAAKAMKSLVQAAEDVKQTQKQIKSHKKAEKKLSKVEKKDAKKSAAVVGEVVDAAKASPKKKRHPLRTLLVVGTIGAVVAMVVSEDARKVVLDALFGAEEEFQYTSHASTASSTNGAS